MQNEFKQKLNSVRSGADQFYASCNDVKAICTKAMEELTAYETCIPEFFSYKNEAVRIKDLYKKLKGLDYVRNRVMTCIDVGCAGYLYKEYFSGMYTFLDKFFSEARGGGNAETIALMEKQLQTAIQGDPVFIDSLFGGKNNAPSEQVLTDAIGNVEYLVDFLENIKGMKQMVGDVCSVACEFSNANYEPAVKAVKLIVNSSCLFSYRIIDTIMDIYNDIHMTIDDKPTQTSVEDTSFKVF